MPPARWLPEQPRRAPRRWARSRRRALTAGVVYLELDEYVNGNGGVLADSAAQGFNAGELETIPTRITVYGGEHLGLAADGGAAPAFRSADSADKGLLISPVIPQGGFPPMQPAPGQGGGVLIGVAVTLEPDADHDGYGDLTQDLCSTDPKHQDACPKPPPAGGSNSSGGSVSTSSPAIAGVPHIKLSASKRESIRRGFITLVLSSDSDVTASISGPVKRRSLDVSANRATTLKLKITSKQVKSIRKRLRHHRKAVATITVTVKNAAGATSSASLQIGLGR